MNIQNNNIEQIGTTNDRRVFSLSEAKELLQLVYFLTENSQKKSKSLMNRLHAAKLANLVLASSIEEELNTEYVRWQNKVQRLGLVPKGTWLVDFDNGSGYFCWKFPETDIRYWHAYHDGFSGRVEIQ
jgi:hypothetical protein